MSGLINRQMSESEELRAQASRDELVERLARVTGEDRTIEPLPGLVLHRYSAPLKPSHGVTRGSLCVIAQGSKQVQLGNERYQYDPFHYLLATAGLPVTGQLLEASREKPYLSLRMDLDAELVGSVMIQLGHYVPPSHAEVRAISVSFLDAGLLDAVLRLVRLVETPAEAPFLAPLVKREIVYRLWMGEQGERLRYIAALGGYTHHIAKTVDRLRQDLSQPLRIEAIARDLGMSVSGFHHHFKAVTAMSPLQFQKRLRLQEARRLLLSERLDAASAAYRVGYNDASQFSREYKRLFGLPPIRDVQQLRVGVNVAEQGADGGVETL